MKTNTHPLRKVIGRETHKIEGTHAEATYERLECGHLVLPKQDIYGETNAVRRRCRFCGRRAAGDTLDGARHKELPGGGR